MANYTQNINHNEIGKVFMISQFEDVKVSYLLHKILHQSEQNLRNLTKFPSFYQKSQLSKTLLLSLVRFARFLVVYRWSKLHISETKTELSFFCWEKYVFNLLHQFKHFHSHINQNQQQTFFNSAFSLFEQNNEETNFKINKIINNQKNQFQVMCAFLGHYKKIKHIRSIHVIRPFVIINAQPYYHLMLKIKIRSKICHIHRLKLQLDKNFHFSLESIKKIIARLEPFDLERPNELDRIDSFLFSFYVINFFGSVVRQLSKYAEDFKCTISRDASNSIIIAFPNSYQPFNLFILKANLISNQIELYSKATLFTPPKDLRTINEVHEKLSVDKFTPTSIYCRIIDISEKFSASGLLSRLRDVVFYTNVQRFWHFLKSAMRSTEFSRFRLFLKCDSESVLDISIYFLNTKCPLLTIVFHPISGLPIFVPISNYFKFDQQPMFLDARKIFTSVFTQHVQYMDFCQFFKPHILSLIRSFELKETINIRFNFSFSNHYFYEKVNEISYPKFQLKSYDNPENLNPRTLLIKQLTRSGDFNPLFNDIVTNISITSKLYVVLLELENKLKSKGIFSKRDVNTIYVPSMCCKFKIDVNEYWSITIEKPLIQYIESGKIIIFGNKLCLRFIDIIFNLMKNCYDYGLLVYSLRHCIVFNNDCETHLNPFGIHFRLFFEPCRSDFYKDGHLFHYFTIYSFIYPSIKMKPLYFTPFSNYAQHINNDDDQVAYFSRLIYYQNKIWQVFNSKNWKVIPFFKDNSFSVIYRNELTIIFHRIHDGSHIMASVSIYGLSSILLVPLGHFFKIHESKAPIASVYMTIFEMEKIKAEIEKFDELITAFHLMKIDHLFYNKGKVYGKGTRFYLVQAVLDEQGIRISSPSFPSLIKITSAIYALKIGFDSKKKIFMFILGMLLFTSNIIVSMLNVLKELIQPYRIDCLNWEDMAKYLKIDSNELTAELIIIENDQRVSLLFDNPSTHSIRVIKNNNEKRMSAKEFSDIYLHLNPQLSISDQFNI